MSKVPDLLPGVLRYYEVFARENEADPLAQGFEDGRSSGAELVEKAMSTILEETVEYIPKDCLFSSFATSAKIVMDAHIGLLTLFDSTMDVQHFVGREGTTLPGTEMRHSFCRHMRGHPELLVLHASQDDRFKLNPLVTGDIAKLEFYYGVPVIIDGEQIGAICVLSSHTQPIPTDGQKAAMRSIADCASLSLLERRKMVKRIASQSSRIVGMLEKELRLESKQKYMKAEMRLRDESINQICYDIRSHMTTIRMTLEDVKNAVRMGILPDLYEMESALHILDSQDRILRRRLDAGRLINGHYQVQMSTFEIGRLVNSILQRQGVAAGTDVDFITDVEGELWVDSDAYLVGQVIENLVGNARRYTKQGFVKVAADVFLADEGCEKCLRIVVADSGAGIPPEKLGRLFRRYPTAGSKSSGAGLGLFLVDRIASLLSGYVRVLWTRTKDFKYTDTSVEGVASEQKEPLSEVGVREGASPDGHPTRSSSSWGQQQEPVQPTPQAATNGKSLPEHSGTAFEFVVPISSIEQRSPMSTASNFSAMSGHSRGQPFARNEFSRNGSYHEDCPQAEWGPSRPAETYRRSPNAPPEADAGVHRGCLRAVANMDKTTVLVVDDSSSFRTSLERTLRSLDGELPWKVRGAETAEEALAILRRSPAHVVVLDETLALAGGAMTGTEATALLRSQGYDGIIIGIRDSDDILQKQFTSGVDISWEKPPPPAHQMRLQLADALTRRDTAARIGVPDQTHRFMFMDGDDDEATESG
eukprot:scaffold4971_cov254-Pinguiococcus_pyrenoidosus.AAC.1